MFICTSKSSCTRHFLLRTWPAGERPGIVVLTIGLEESLPKLPGAVTPSKLWSPYRLPLIRFLNQYPADRQVWKHGGNMHSQVLAGSNQHGTLLGSSRCSVTYFLESPSRLANECYFSRLLDIVRRPEGAPLLKALSEAESQLAGVFDAKPDAGMQTAMALLEVEEALNRAQQFALLLPLNSYWGKSSDGATVPLSFVDSSLQTRMHAQQHSSTAST